MSFPDGVIAGKAEVYIAPAATAFPAVDEAPASEFILVGDQGSLSYTEDGVTITSSITTSEFVPLGDIHAVKSWLTGEDLRVTFNLADISLESLSHALGGPATAAGDVATVAAASGTAGYKSLSLTRDSTPEQVAMLIRINQSPYDSDPSTNAFDMQIELNRVANVSAVPLTFQKGTPATVAFEYRIYRDASGVGRIVAQTAVAAA